MICEGNGLCLGQSPPSYTNLCNESKIPTGTGYLISLDDAWWAWSTCTSCVHAQVLNDTQYLGVLVQLGLQITYHPQEEIFYWLRPPKLAKLEGFMAVLVSSHLGLCLARTIGMATSILILKDQNAKAFIVAMEADITIYRSLSPT